MTGPDLPLPDAYRELFEAVAACPDRGAEVAAPPGCRCPSRPRLCRAGKGRVPGVVTLEDCVRCRYEADR